jgi:hypothetical protein
MAALLVRRRLDMSAAESVDDLAQVEQIVEPAKAAHDRAVIAVRWRAAGVTCVPVGPLRRNERAAAVGNADEQKQDAAPPDAADHSQRLAFESVALAGDDHRIRNITVMGSLWPLPSTQSRTSD